MLPSSFASTRMKNPFILIMNLLLILVMSTTIAMASTCNIDVCSREYASSFEMSHRQSPSSPSSPPSSSSPSHCHLLTAYSQCIRAISRSCRGNLEFHTVQSLIKQWIIHHNCSSGGGG